MNRRLIYVVGPSGAGKDSLLLWLRGQAGGQRALHWARRTITRADTAGGESHEGVDTPEFERLVTRHALALHWRANGLRYGVRHTELAPLAQQRWVMLNGSRAHLAQTAQQYPGMTVLHITAHAQVLRARLVQRGRETLAAIEARVERSVDMHAPAGSRFIEIHNNADLATAGQQLLQALQALEGWPVDAVDR